MKKSWPKQDINMNTLTQQLIQFFESRKFEEVTALKTEAGYQIIAGSSPHYKMNTDVSATIEERPEDFSVNLEPCKEEKRFSLPIILTSMFGGGYFLLKNLRSEEEWHKFERDFWHRIDSITAQMKDVAPLQENENEQGFADNPKDS